MDASRFPLMRLPVACSQNVLRTLKPIQLTSDQEEIRRISNIIKPSKISMLNVTKPRDILFQNVDCLRANNMIIRLEDLLIMNTKNLETSCQMLPAKVLNRFLKLWTRGSNSQLERLQLDFELDGSFMEEEIFAGLKTTRNNTVRYFESDRETREITGGMDIFRFDGTMATILVDNINFFLGINFYFEMFVWHDHCIAKETDL